MLIQLPAHSLYGNEPVDVQFPNDWDVQVSSFQGESEPALTEREFAAFGGLTDRRSTVRMPDGLCNLPLCESRFALSLKA